MSWYLYRLTAHRPDFAETMSEAEMATMMEHVDYWRGPLADGRVLIYSPVADPERSWGLCVVRAESQAELEELRDNDPAHVAGIGTIDWLLLPMPVVADLPAHA
ncbi:hypothetical protein [Aeromicrobium sp. NPDC092404]|uniref:hypothetical protein n=1 Tax=Aeromicrobium sp. NPDC092404 TaxID=3154976 RepID=UPI00342A3366